MLLAHRPGSSDWLIPAEWRGQYEARGYRMLEAPPGLPEVSAPVLLRDHQALARGGCDVSSSHTPAPSVPETEPSKRRRRA